MGHHSAIQSVESVIRAAMRLPRFMRSKFYQDFKDSTYNDNDLNLEYFEKWLANRLTEIKNFMQNRWLQEASSYHNAPSKPSGN